jgi:hypothetical protein
MLQPERTFWLGRSIGLSGTERGAFDEKYPGFPLGLHFPLRIEVEPGEHAFYYDGGASYLTCIIELNMQAGHVYKPDGDPRSVVESSGCNAQKGCLLNVIDTNPDGGSVKLPIACYPAYFYLEKLKQSTLN